MGILNYTSSIDPAKTIGEIQKILGAKGAKSVSAEYSKGEAVALYFSIDLNGRPLNFRLPCNHEKVLSVMQRDSTIAKGYRTPEQAKRTAWRIIKDWVEAQMALVEAEQADLAEVFIPYAVMQNGTTFYHAIEQGKVPLLLEAP